MALVQRDYPKEAIKNLRVGDYFIEGGVARLLECPGYRKIVMENGVVYTAHYRGEFCTLHRRTEPTRFERHRMEQKQRKAEIRAARGGNEQ
jgi:hypothetical protein